ncbi:MAG: TonB-dependent receptor, partial [Pseudomonadota bacterium]
MPLQVLRLRGSVILVLSFSILLSSFSAWAQEDSAVKSYSVPAGSLSEAISEFAQQAGIAISVDSTILRGIQSSGFSASVTVQEGIERLLQGTNLEAVQSPSGYRIQPLPETGSLRLQPITIRGELFERDAQDSLTSVISEPGERLRQRGEVSIDAFTSRMGNVNGQTIRGIAVGGPSGTGRGQTVTTTIDGARVSTFFDQNVGTYSSWDLEQVEVLRGPQSTQTGRNALAGSITIRSQDPIFDQTLKLGAQLGNSGTRQLGFAANTPVIDDVLAIRVSGEKLESDSFDE